MASGTRSSTTSSATTAIRPSTGNNPIAFVISEVESTKPIPQPSSRDEAVTANWQRQMLVPFMVADRLFAFLGPLLDDKTQPTKLKEFFPCYPPTIPLHMRVMESLI